MPRKHVNLKIEDTLFQVSMLDPFFHRSYNQSWMTSERNPILMIGDEWRDTGLPLDLTRAMDQAVLACSTLSKKIASGTYPQVKSMITHISRNDVTFMLELNERSIKNEILLQYTWDKNAQLIPPTDFNKLSTLGISPHCQKNLEEDLTKSSFGRLGLVARCLRLMSNKTYKPDTRPQMPMPETQTA